MLAYVCAWCSALLEGTHTPGAIISHGICEKCGNKMQANLLHRRTRALAELLISWEARNRAFSEAAISPVFLVIDKLRPHLATLMGHNGFRALLSRALVIATAEYPTLKTIQVNPDGCLAYATIKEELPSPQKLQKGEVALLVQLLGLLVALIGELLTVRLVREIWPNLPANALKVLKGTKNEKE